MKRIYYSAKFPTLAAFAVIILISSLPVYGQASQPAGDDRQFNLLVLGDSITWGQGLKDEHKIWYLVKAWLEATGGRQVRERIEAHSGAVVGSVGDSGGNSASPLDGEINRALPSVNDQIER